MDWNCLWNFTANQKRHIFQLKIWMHCWELLPGMESEYCSPIIRHMAEHIFHGDQMLFFPAIIMEVCFAFLKITD